MNHDPGDALRERARSGDAEAAFQLGRSYAARREFGRARRTLRAAAELGHGAALTELALFELWGIGIPQNFSEGLRLLLQAEAAGCGEAMWNLAWLGFGDGLVRFDQDEIAARLRRAAELDFAPALRAIALIYRRRSAEEPTLAPLPIRCLQRAAALGDGPALLLLGIELAASSDAATSEYGLACLATAAARGSSRAAQRLGDRRPAAAAPSPGDSPPPGKLPPIELRLGIPVERKSWSTAPFVETFDGLMSELECEYIIALGEPHVHSSFVVDEEQSELVRNEHRTSSDMAFYSFQEDFGLRWLQWRMADLIDVPLHHCEHLVLLRYRQGEQYRPHRDYLPPGAAGNSRRADEPGQRRHTVFTYLCDVESGGETAFPLQQIRIQPRRGRVVHFLNLKPDGSPDDSTLHAGLPVERGNKWLATLWARERRYRNY